MPRKMTTVRTRVSTTSNRQPRAGRCFTGVGGSQDREYRGGSVSLPTPSGGSRPAPGEPRQSGPELTPRNGPRYTPAALETGRESARGAPPRQRGIDPEPTPNLVPTTA